MNYIKKKIERKDHFNFNKNIIMFKKNIVILTFSSYKIIFNNNENIYICLYKYLIEVGLLKK